MGFINYLAKFIGETMRIKRTENQEEKLDPKTKQWIDTLRQRAQNGDADAMYELGGYYYKGKDVPYDPDQACQWWTEAANRGNVNAQYNLGLLYKGGVSTYFCDDNLAGYWFNMAACNGDEEALKELKNYKYSEFRKKWVKIS